MKIPKYTYFYVGWLENYMEKCQKEIETPFAFSKMDVKGQQWHIAFAGFTEGFALSYIMSPRELSGYSLLQSALL